MGIFILYTRRKSKVRRFFFKFSSNLQVGGISILLLREGGVQVVLFTRITWLPVLLHTA